MSNLDVKRPSVLLQDQISRDLIIYKWVRASNIVPPKWVQAKTQTRCSHCDDKLKRGHNHNCRLCGYVFCSMCTGKYNIPVEYRKKGKKGAARVCFGCRDVCLANRNKTTQENICVRPNRVQSIDESGNLVITPPKWIETSETCMECHAPLDSSSNWHICRLCGYKFCDPCTTKVAGVLQCFLVKGKTGATRSCFECRYLTFRKDVILAAPDGTAPGQPVKNKLPQLPKTYSIPKEGQLQFFSQAGPPRAPKLNNTGSGGPYVRERKEGMPQVNEVSPSLNTEDKDPLTTQLESAFLHRSMLNKRIPQAQPDQGDSTNNYEVKIQLPESQGPLRRRFLSGSNTGTENNPETIANFVESPKSWPVPRKKSGNMKSPPTSPKSAGKHASRPVKSSGVRLLKSVRKRPHYGDPNYIEAPRTAPTVAIRSAVAKTQSAKTQSAKTQSAKTNTPPFGRLELYESDSSGTISGTSSPSSSLRSSPSTKTSMIRVNSDPVLSSMVPAPPAPVDVSDSSDDELQRPAQMQYFTDQQFAPKSNSNHKRLPKKDNVTPAFPPPPPRTLSPLPVRNNKMYEEPTDDVPPDIVPPADAFPPPYDDDVPPPPPEFDSETDESELEDTDFSYRDRDNTGSVPPPPPDLEAPPPPS